MAYNNFPVDIQDLDTKKELIALAKKCVKLLNLRFCSVDIICCNGQYKILEINSIVSTKLYATYKKENMKKIEKLYLKAIKKCFGGEN